LSIVIFVAGCAVGCATPAPLVRLDPRGTRGVAWVAGRAVIEREAAGVRVATAFEVQDGSLLALRLEIQNLTPAPFEVSPDDFTFMTCAEVDNESCRGSWAVVDPEEMIDAFDERRSLETAHAKNQAALDTGLVLLNVVGDVATIADGRATSTTGLGTITAVNNAQVDALRAEATITSLASSRQNWSNVAFRRSTIAPGQGASGLIYIPIENKARFVWINARAGGQTFPFGFSQTVGQARYASSRGYRTR